MKNKINRNFKNSEEYLSRKVYIDILKKMSPEQRLLKSFELTELGYKLFFTGLKERYADLSEEEVKKIYIKKLIECHNRNY
jgi:hypothetical protein